VRKDNRRSALGLRVSPVGNQWDILEPSPESFADRLGGHLRTHRPVVAGGVIVLVGYLVMAALAMGLGLLITKVLVGGAVERWDHSGNQWFVAQRTPLLNSWTNVGSELGATFTVIGIAALACIILAIGRHWRELGFIVASLVIEASVSFTTSTLITRTRPDVPRLDAAQPTGSFPSGHTAAAIVLYVSLALVITSLVRSTPLRALAWLLAITLPIYVGFSRLYQGMHHPTDLMGSAVIAVGSLLFGLLACRTAVAVTDRRTNVAGRTHSAPSEAKVVS
jgi:membrane-associated phospholipid phosphatase